MMPSGDSINFELGNIKEACKAIVLAAVEIGRAKEMSRFDEEPDGTPHNICVAAIARLMNQNEALRQQLAEMSKQAKQFETLRKALNKIANLDPKFDSDEGFNEWGEADCFIKAQKIALAATEPKEQGK
jgi:ribosomal protein L16 Arg81 hydroxylase